VKIVHPLSGSSETMIKPCNYDNCRANIFSANQSIKQFHPESSFPRGAEVILKIHRIL